MTNSTTRVAGPACFTDIHGERLCCSAASSKRDNGGKRGEMRAQWVEALSITPCPFPACHDGVCHGTMAFIHDGNVWVVCADGIARPRHDDDSTPSRERDGLADFGHIVADAAPMNGVYCGGNAVGLEGVENREDGNAAPDVHPAYPWDEYIASWRTVRGARITATKRARMV